MNVCVLALWIITDIFVVVTAKYSVGTLATSNNWVFLERFCFVPNEGLLQYTVQYPARYEPQSLYLYYDIDSQWNAAYSGILTCQQKEDILDPTNHQILRLTPEAELDDGQPTCDTVDRNNETWYLCHGQKSFFSMRPRWWFLAVGNCNSSQGIYLEYSMLMTNGSPRSRWFYQFSFDEFYALPISVAYLILQLFIDVVACVFAYMLKARKMLHMTYKIFLHALMFELLSVCLLWMHYDRYSDDGQGLPIFKDLALLCRAKLRFQSSCKLVLFTLTFLALHIIHVVWAIVLFDPAKVTYLYESVPAYFISGLRLVAWLWYLSSCWITVRKYPQKKYFYYCLSFFITFWFWASPVVLVIANFVLDNWVRAEVVLGVDCGVATYGFVLFLALTCPVSENKNFPYHVRTNQISQVDYPQNVYEMQYSAPPDSNAHNVVD
ncbi:rhodopsin-like GPCR transmembrane domain-containing protein [Ditylenchus destructor]|uniref:Rhodopsin-like GPCR transmembrane domain-containing protein n=1 Tax=Ditylenchus destructor TaxID=166010 RepID=A0AAD4NC56_9BILA|nr:rhodopsin-like GPCR transmembrane domain-containing protein [Ditylenchus destructor]